MGRWAFGVVLVGLVAVAEGAQEVPCPPPPFEPLESRPILVPPPRPVGMLEFVSEVGVDRCQARLGGEVVSVLLGNCPTTIDDFRAGMRTVLYEDMTILTGRGRQCSVRIEKASP